MQTTLDITKMIVSVFYRVENTVGKGEIASYEHFLLFPQCFQKPSFPDPSKGVIVWEWVKHIYKSHVLAKGGLMHYHGTSHQPRHHIIIDL